MTEDLNSSRDLKQAISGTRAESGALFDLTEEFDYLDRLRASGRTNMMNAPAFLRIERLLNEEDAGRIFLQWQSTFDRDKTAAERAGEALGTSTASPA